MNIEDKIQISALDKEADLLRKQFDELIVNRDKAQAKVEANRLRQNAIIKEKIAILEKASGESC